MINDKIEAIVANFSRLSDQECAFVLQNNILEAFEADTAFEWELIAKLFNVGYELRGKLCRFFDNALMQNEQKISGTSVKEWIRRYQLKYPPNTIRLSTFFDFVARSPETSMLTDKDKIRLLKIFRIRDFLLITPIFDMEDQAISSILNLPMRLTQSFDEIKREIASTGVKPEDFLGSVSERLSVKKFLQKYSRIGEQPITNSPIKIRSFDQPVRPSIRNWLYDYTSHLGQTGHSSMDRTNFLFRSENAINLSSPEREKLGIILKSFDENTPLPIDAGRQEVVFEEFLRKAAPQAPAAQRPAFTEPENASSTNFIHHVERQPVRQAPPSSNVFAEPKQKSPSELFIRPYDRIGTSKKELGQSSAFVRPSSPRVQAFPTPTSREIPQGQTLDNSPKTSPAGFPQGRALGDNQKSDFQMKFANPYPSPGTHESKFEQKNDNIANVSFSEGIPRTPTAQFSARRVPERGSAPAANVEAKSPLPAPKPTSVPQTAKPIYQRPQMNRNIIYPHLVNEFPSGKPEPRIKGNVVDLSMNNDQGTTNNKR